MSGETDNCVSLLENSGRVPEAALFAVTYDPRRVASLVDKWRKDFKSIACPVENAELFEGLSGVIDVEETSEEVDGETVEK